MTRNSIVMLVMIGVASALSVAAQEKPQALTVLTAKAQLEGPIVAWCGAEFRSGQRGAFAVAVNSAAGGGRYVALDSDGRVTELAAFKSGAELACYSPAEAAKLNRTIKQSETIDGSIAPRWKTTVVCGFIDDTSAACWQYSPADRTFVKIGQWVT
jgi:hypothetical protein